MIETSASIATIAAALLDFQGRVEGVSRDSDNPFFKSKYADLEQVVNTARPHLQEAGIAFLQSPGAIVDGCLSMTTMLVHSGSGEWIRGTGDIPLGKKDPQGAGSAQTYAQRYHLMAMLGLPPTDDDGEEAMDRKPANKPQQRPAVAPVRDQLSYPAHLSAISNATSLDALKAAFTTAQKDKTLNKGEVDDLILAKDARKAELAAPNFDQLDTRP